jgi:hypothetical protein
MWCLGARTDFHHSSQNTNSSIEAYHGVMKTGFSSDRKTGITRDIQWLLWMLETFLLPHYMYKVTPSFCARRFDTASTVSELGRCILM